MEVRLHRVSQRKTEFYEVQINDLFLYFSYGECVAFSALSVPITVCENVWGPTTGRHLNELGPRKESRLPHAEFQRRLAAVLSPPKSEMRPAAMMG
jgi:hypothetical protein